MRIKKGFFLHSVGGERIVMQDGTSTIDFSRIVSLNPTAAYLWEKINENDFDTEIVAKMLMEKYDIENNVALHDAEAFITKLREAGVIEE